jgi:hypothetical protein
MASQDNSGAGAEGCALAVIINKKSTGMKSLEANLEFIEMNIDRQEQNE